MSFPHRSPLTVIQGTQDTLGGHVFQAELFPPSDSTKSSMLAALCPTGGTLTLWKMGNAHVPSLGSRLYGGEEQRLTEPEVPSSYVHSSLPSWLDQPTPAAPFVPLEESPCPSDPLLCPSLGWNTVPSCYTQESTVNMLFLQWQLTPLGCFSGDSEKPSRVLLLVPAHTSPCVGL